MSEIPVTLRVHMHMRLEDVDKLITDLPFFSEGSTPRNLRVEGIVVEAVRDQSRDPDTPYAEITVGARRYDLEG